MVRTPGFHPGNRSSILLRGATVMILVDIFGQIKNKKRIREYAEDSLTYLLPPVTEDIFIDITFKKSLDNDMLGYCLGDSNSSEIEIAKTFNNEKLSIDDMMLSLAHELIHAKQFIRGELSPSNSNWKGTIHEETIYSKRPWEKQAYLFEDLIFNTFWKNLHK